MARPARARTAILMSAALAAMACARSTAETSAPRAPEQQPPARAAQPQGTANGQTRVNPQAALAAEFTRRVEEYVALHRKIEDSLPRLSKDASPQEIDNYQRELGRLIAKARAAARPADVFAKEIRAYFRRQIAAAFAGPEGRKLKGSIMDENPGAIRLAVNARYPDAVPLATMPPQVLAELPRLPEELEYRFIGSRLILLDVHAHIIVDYIDGALPD